MSEFVLVASTSELSENGTLLVEVDDRLVMLARVGDRYFALDDLCTHDGGPLSDGALGEDCTIACPRHGAKFDLATGAALTMPATQPTQAHEVRVEGDQILVRLGDGSQSQPTPTATETSLPTTTSEPCCEASAAAEAGEAPAAACQETGSTSPAGCSGELNQSVVLETLKQVIDPELFVNIVDLGLIYEVGIEPAADLPDKSDVKVEMTMTSPACPAAPQLLGQSQSFLERLDTVNEVEIKLVMQPPWTPDRMTEDARDQLGIF